MSLHEHMQMSYVQPQAATTNLASLLNTYPVNTGTTWSALPAQMREPVTTQDVTLLAARTKEKPMARLIRFTVVDPDAVLADKKPEASILLAGTVMLNGTDDKGFLMDLAPRVADRLADHNREREGVEYEDPEGKSKRLKPIKLSQLDVVVEQLKAY